MRSLSLLATVTAVFAAPFQHCNITFDGRVPKNYSVETFDDPSKYVFHPIIFTKSSRPVEVTINDGSIFLAGGTLQTGFRHESVQGVKTFHFSFKTDPTRPLNYSHEYHLLWHETNDYSTSEWVLQTGKPFSSAKDPGVKNPRTIRLTGRQSETPETLIWSTDFLPNVWHNLALTVGWDTSVLSVYYSQGTQPLRRVVKNAANDNLGGGQFHFGLFKLPTGPETIDVVHEGYQGTGINEGIVWDGVFIEDSSDGCVSLRP
ncbi:hypothetical protein DL96DRAFT_1670385 [Flagelloscypha sp. PMI_526]|nr:hypothetical protein DL96DRAFT_1670385 [Flagelloscypha sp. PMI_526]